MANVIILIHGLGNKPPKQLLTLWWKLAMIEGLRRRKYKTLLPKYEMVYWADILHDKPLDEDERDAHNPYYLDEKYRKAPKNFQFVNHDFRKKVVGYISRQLNRIFLKEDLSLQYNYILDAIIKRYFKDLEIYYSDNYKGKNEQVNREKVRIRERLLDVLEKHKEDKIMLVSHSMGSIIAYDVLNFLAPDIKIHTFVTMGSPLGLPIVVSKIASEQKSKKSEKPVLLTPPGVYKNWFNFSDIMDKVALNYMLTDDFSENSHGVKPVDFLVTNDYIMNGKPNPHKSFGYLRTPEFAKVLNKFILSEKLSPQQKVVRQTANIIKDVKTQILIQTDRLIN